MATLFETRQTSLLSLGDGNTPAVPLTRMGFPALMTKWDMFALAGRMFNLKQTTIGTALAGATAAGGSIVLTVPWVQFTVPTGYTVFPRHLNLAVAAHTGTVSEIAMIYTATDSYTSGGTPLIPLNWRTDNPRSTSVTNCVVGPSGGVITEAALVSVRSIYQDVIPATFAANATDQYCIDKWWDDLIPIVGPSSVVLYFGGVTTTPTGYFSMDWAEVLTVNVKES
jgi:hypothetical protein